VAKIKPLKENVLFKDFTDKEIAILSKYVEEKNYPAATPLFLENMKGEAMYILVKGSIQLSKMLSEGETKTLTTLESGDFFGEMALIEDGPRPVTAMVVKESQMLLMKRSGFETLMDDNPRVAVKMAIGMYRTLSDRIRESSPKIQQLLMSK
jgi:CRP/FNR family transcriptional regulator